MMYCYCLDGKDGSRKECHNKREEISVFSEICDVLGYWSCIVYNASCLFPMRLYDPLVLQVRSQEPTEVTVPIASACPGLEPRPFSLYVIWFGTWSSVFF